MDCLRIDAGYRFDSLLTTDFTKRVLDFSLYLRKNWIYEDYDRISAGITFLRLVLLKQRKKDLKLLPRTEITELKEEYLLPLRVKLTDSLEKAGDGRIPDVWEHKLKLLEVLVMMIFKEGV